MCAALYKVSILAHMGSYGYIWWAPTPHITNKLVKTHPNYSHQILLTPISIFQCVAGIVSGVGTLLATIN